MSTKTKRRKIDQEILSLKYSISKLQTEKISLLAEDFPIGTIVKVDHQAIADYLYNKDNNYKIRRPNYQQQPTKMIVLLSDDKKIALGRIASGLLGQYKLDLNNYNGGYIPNLVLSGDYEQFIKKVVNIDLVLPEDFNIVWGNTCIHDSHYKHL